MASSATEKDIKEVEMEKRAAQAESWQDPVEKDLFIRYNMDPEVWRKSQRNHFPYNVPLDLIVGVPLVLPIAALIVDLAFIDKDYSYLMTVIQTLGVSICAFYISDKLIESFKENLQKKGLFGRDLNKAGIQKDKKPVPEALGIIISITFLLVTIQ